MPDRLQQGIALPKHLLIILPDPSQSRLKLYSQGVQQTSSYLGRSFDQFQVFRGEQHSAQNSQDLRGAYRAATVDPCPVGAARVDLHFQECCLGTAVCLRPNDRLFGAVTHQRSIIGDAV